ncbi:MAG: hypothetical protein ACR2JO_07815 [Mycobacteriales bacterium]
MTITDVQTDARDGTTHPYGVRVGDPVHYWRADAPPLSETYEAPACWHGLVLGFSYDDARSIWLADLVVVDPHEGSLHLVRAAPQSESTASTVRIGGECGEPSWGVGASWHRPITGHLRTNLRS